MQFTPLQEDYAMKKMFMLLAVFGLVGIAAPRVAEAARWQVGENCGPDHVLTQIWYDNDSDGFEFIDVACC
jgi:hypothetical protein